jgi:hypothetical protein
MDRVYKLDIPASVQSLEALRAEFAKLPSKTDWTRLRIDPLLSHARSLAGMLRSKEFARETARLRVGVGMFHADLIYFRENIRGLKKVLESERAASVRRE